MLDYQLYGLRAGGHHLTSLLLHTLNALLLLIALRRLTDAFWRSVLVAALFAWHPTHVESVAWAAERKDVLSTFFFLLTLWSYVRYVQVSGRQRSMIDSQEAANESWDCATHTELERPNVPSEIKNRKSKIKNA